MDFGTERLNLTRIHGDYNRVAVGPNAKYLYAADVSGLTLIDTHTNTPIRTISWQEDVYRVDLALNDDGTRLYVLYGIKHEPDFRDRDVTSKILVLDTAKLADATADPWEPSIELGIGVHPAQIRVAPAGNQIYATGTTYSWGGGFPFEEDPTMWVIDVSGVEPVINKWKTVVLPGGSLSPPHDVTASSPTGERVYYLAYGYDQPYIVEFDTTTGTIVDKVAVDSDSGSVHVEDLALSNDSTHIYLNNGQVIDTTGEQLTIFGQRMEGSGNFVFFGPTDDRLYLTNRQGSLTVIDTVTGQPIGEPITIGNYVHGAAMNPKGGTLYALTHDDAPAIGPKSVEELWQSLQNYTNDGNQGIFIQTVRDDNDTTRIIVYLGGTNDIFGAGNQSVIENVNAEVGVIKCDQKNAIRDVLNRCATSSACGPVSEIMIVGFSQGGIDAQNLANVGHSRDGLDTWEGFDVAGIDVPITTIVTFGSPIVSNPHDVVILHIQDREDEIVNLERIARWLGDTSPVARSLLGPLLSARKNAQDNGQIMQGNASTTPNVLNPFWHVHGDPETYRELSGAFDDLPDTEYARQQQALARFLDGTTIDSR